MKDAAVIKTGIAGSTIAAICCFTPALVVLFGALGVSAWLGWIDYVLFPALALFLGMTAYGLWRREKAAACCDVTPRNMKETGHG